MKLNSANLRKFWLKAGVFKYLSKREFNVLKELLLSQKILDGEHKLFYPNKISNETIGKRSGYKGCETARLAKIDLQSRGILTLDGKSYEEYLKADGYGGTRRPPGCEAQKIIFTKKFVDFIQNVLSDKDAKWEFEHHPKHVEKLDQAKEAKKPKNTGEKTNKKFWEYVRKPTQVFRDGVRAFYGKLTKKVTFERIERRSIAESQKEAYLNTLVALEKGNQKHETKSLDESKALSFITTYNCIAESTGSNRAVDVIVKSMINQKYAACYSEGIDILKKLLTNKKLNSA